MHGAVVAMPDVGAEGIQIPRVIHMVRHTFELHTATARHARFQSKPRRMRQSHEYPIQGMATMDFCERCIRCNPVDGVKMHHALA